MWFLERYHLYSIQDTVCPSRSACYFLSATRLLEAGTYPFRPPLRCYLDYRSASLINDYDPISPERPPCPSDHTSLLSSASLKGLHGASER